MEHALTQLLRVFKRSPFSGFHRARLRAGRGVRLVRYCTPVGARSDPRELLEMTVKMALIGEPKIHSDICNRQSFLQQTPSAVDPHLFEIGMGREAELLPENPDQIVGG